MKERYYTAASIDKKAALLIKHAREFTPDNTIEFDINQSALLIIDMQNVFLQERFSSYIPSSVAIKPRIMRLQELFHENGRPVIFTRHLNTTKNVGMMSKWWNGFIDEDYSSSEISDYFDYSSDIIVRKSQYDAFLYTDLEDILKEHNISQVVVCGVMTHLCCESTARDAFMRGFAVFFVVDGTATYNEELHRGAVVNLAHGFAKPVMVSDFLSAVDQR